VEIQANTSLNYTSYEPDPHRFILEIPNVDLSALPDELEIGRMGVQRAVITPLPSHGEGSHARIEFIGEGELAARIVPDGTTLSVRLIATSPPPPVSEVADASKPEASPRGAVRAIELKADPIPEVSAPPAPLFPATAVTGVVAESAGSGKAISIIGDGSLEHRDFVLTGPDRVVIDLVGVQNGVPERAIEVSAEPLSRIRIAQFRTRPERIVRVVLDVTRPVDYEVVADGDGVRVLLDEAAWAWRESPSTGSDAPPVLVAAARNPVMVPVEPPKVSVGAAKLSTPEPEPAPIPETAAEAAEVIEPEPPPVAAVSVENLPELKPRAIPASPMDLGADVVLFDRSDPSESAAPTLVGPQGGVTFESHTISTGARKYRGEKISVTFRDADIREVFFFLADVMKVNLVLDPDVAGRIDIRLRQVPWDQVFYVVLKNQGLDAVEEENVVRIAKTSKLRQEAAERRALKQAKEQEVDPITFTRRLSYAEVDQAMTILSQVKTDRGKIIADNRTNTLIITDIPEKRPDFENLIDALDTQTPQVSIEARIVEATRDFQRSLGIDWNFTGRADTSLGTNTNLDFPHNATVQADVNLASPRSAGTLGIALGNVLDSVTLDVTLDAFEADGKVRILSAPKVVTQNNQSANIEQGVQIPVVTTTATEIEVQYVPASLRLEVTPQITAEETVIMKVLVENNQPSTTVSVGETPGIVTERVDTQILVRSGTTAVIGGVYKLSETDNESGIPGLRRIPFFGWLFKNKSFQKSSSELLVFLTPKIVHNI
jgi:type IV pilus assembly protein PilQ